MAMGRARAPGREPRADLVGARQFAGTGARTPGREGAGENAVGMGEAPAASESGAGAADAEVARADAVGWGAGRVERSIDVGTSHDVLLKYVDVAITCGGPNVGAGSGVAAGSDSQCQGCNGVEKTTHGNISE